MSQHMYTASFAEVAVTAAQDFFQLLASGTVGFKVHSIRIGQSSDAADAQAEMLPITIGRSDMTVNGSGGSTITPALHSPGSSAAATVAEANNTTVSTVVTVVVADTFNVQAGWLYLPTPDEQILILPTEGLVVTLEAAPDDSLTVSGSITFEEIK